MSIDRKDIEIRTQVHLMDAEGCYNDRPTPEEIIQLLKAEGWGVSALEIWYDDVQNLWRSYCKIKQGINKEVDMLLSTLNPNKFEVLDVYIAWSNDALNEGRGRQFPLFVCKVEATAIRLGKNQYVRGSDCPVQKSFAIKYQGDIYIPAQLRYPNADDEKEETAKQVLLGVIEKAKLLGLSDDDLQTLKGI